MWGKGNNRKKHRSMKRIVTIIVIIVTAARVGAVNVQIDDPERWTSNELSQYIGQTVTFTTDWYVCNNYNDNYRISPRRIYLPTNQAIPQSTEYYSCVQLNQYGTVYLNGVTGYHRMGERLKQMTVYVNSTSTMTLQSCTWEGNTRADLMAGINMDDIDMRGQHSLLVCGMNLEYYLVDNLGTGYGAANAAEHARQRQKVGSALAKIGADIYGLVEIEQGQSALSEIAGDLTTATGRTYSFVNDGGTSSGSYTKSGYVYCAETVRPIGPYKYTNAGVARRKFMQLFEEIATGERFVYSINHFKSKSGASSATGDNVDQGDGQGAYNGTRQQEARAVLSLFQSNLSTFGDPDLLIMGDLNAYGMEDPIMILVEGGMTDLHREMHADSSYSYTYHGEAGYLDHALCSPELLPQVTGMTVFHINSDEQDDFTYDKSTDVSMFRCSDHDPVIVGLNLNYTNTDLYINTAEVLYEGSNLTIHNAAGGYLKVYDIDGRLRANEAIKTSVYTMKTQTPPAGMYIVHVYYDGKIYKYKVVCR